MKKKNSNDKVKIKVTKEEKNKQEKKKLTSAQKKEMGIFMLKGVFWICIFGFFMTLISIILYLTNSEPNENGVLIFGYTILGITFVAINILGYFSGIYKNIYGKLKTKFKKVSNTSSK